jgi:hypothetical protein
VEVALEPAPLGLGGLEDPGARPAQLVQARVQVGVQARALEREAGGGADGVEQRALVLERRVVEQSGDRLARAVDDVGQRRSFLRCDPTPVSRGNASQAGAPRARATAPGSRPSTPAIQCAV